MQTYPWECLHDSSHLQSPLHGSRLQTPDRTDSQLGPYHGSTQTHLKNATYESVKQVHTVFVRQIEKERIDARVLTAPIAGPTVHTKHSVSKVGFAPRTSDADWTLTTADNTDNLNKEEYEVKRIEA